MFSRARLLRQIKLATTQQQHRQIQSIPSAPTVSGGMIVEAQQHGKLTDLKSSVLTLYRSFLRASQEDSKLRTHITTEFRKGAAANPGDLQKIDFLLRQGHKKLVLVKTPGFKGVST
jgi:hypothetical protein